MNINGFIFSSRTLLMVNPTTRLYLSLNRKSKVQLRDKNTIVTFFLFPLHASAFSPKENEKKNLIKQGKDKCHDADKRYVIKKEVIYFITFGTSKIDRIWCLHKTPLRKKCLRISFSFFCISLQTNEAFH